MSLENYKINTYLNPVASLPDKPSEMGMTAAELKAAFDANANNEIKESINAVIDHVVSQDESNANTFENKVDKEEGKGLSANDYTDEEKELVAQITNKVGKEEGKGLSANDYSNEEKQKVADAYADKHTHSNKTTLDGVTAEKVAEWDSKVDAEYVNDVVNEKITELGSADMMQATYDPQGKQTDVFRYVDDAVDGITAEDVGASPSSHTHTATEVGALPLNAGEDSALTGNLFIEKASPYLKFKNTSTGGEALMQDYSNELQITLKENSSGTEKRMLILRNVNAATPALENAFVLRNYVGGKYTNYSIYGTHNVTVGTTDLTAGTSTLTTGAIHLVYE